MFIIAGLGNPGKDYKNTRHNIGFITVDYLASLLNVKINKIKQTIIKDFLNRQSKTETFINQIINSGNISNVKEFFGMSLNYELVYLLEKYEEINGSIFYSLEEKEEKFNNVKSI